MLFRELEKFCEEHGLKCAIKIKPGEGALVDAFVNAVAAHLAIKKQVDARN
jgi:hypothetical protein